MCIFVFWERERGERGRGEREKEGRKERSVVRRGWDRARPHTAAGTQRGFPVWAEGSLSLEPSPVACESYIISKLESAAGQTKAPQHGYSIPSCVFLIVAPSAPLTMFF